MQQLQWQGFYKKTIAERKSLVDLLFPDLPSPILSEQQGDFMIENFTTVAGLPLGLALNLVINGNELVVPMVVEEPSVVAAVSGIGKLVAQNGGFIANGPESNMVIAQIQLLDLNDIEIDDAIRLIQSNKQQILELGNKSCTSMVQRGGGFLDLETRKLLRSKPLQDTNFWLVIHLHINVCEAMGANCASTVAESISPYLKSLIKCRIGIRIVSNLIPSRMSSSKFKIRLDKLSYKGIPGKIVADRICEANDWARDDIYRAVTHNKGVMNGIDSVAVATGQDWRAIESSSHTYPFMFNGKYGPITNYEIVEQDRVGYLVGSINLPLQVGVKGGALNTNPLYKYTHRLLGNPTAKQLAMIMCTVGLAQNFAALRALVTEGIQRGHMKLHARNIAIAGKIY